jgi:hypothetical protein
MARCSWSGTDCNRVVISAVFGDDVDELAPGSRKGDSDLATVMSIGAPDHQSLAQKSIHQP